MSRALSNSSPIIILHRAGRLDLLTDAFDEVATARAVVAEVGFLPEGIDILMQEFPFEVGNFPSQLHDGEISIIVAAQHLSNYTLVLDDSKARDLAKRLGIPVIGTAGLLIRAKEEGRIERVTPLIELLADAGLYLSTSLVQHLKKLAGE